MVNNNKPDNIIAAIKVSDYHEIMITIMTHHLFNVLIEEEEEEKTRRTATMNCTIVLISDKINKETKMKLYSSEKLHNFFFPFNAHSMYN